MQKLLTAEAKWVRVIIFAVIFMAVPSLLDKAWTAYRHHYYQTADIATFYQPISIEADNVCVGDKTQDLRSVRFVYQSATGYPAEITRELFRTINGKRIKVYEQKASVFIEVVEDGIVEREGVLPEVSEGIYQWEIGVDKIFLPYGVERTDAGRIQSNNFVVEDCTSNT